MKRYFAIATIVFMTSPITQMASSSVTNPSGPLLDEWKGPYGGLPPFDQVQVPHFKPAFKAAMEQYRANLQKIADLAEAPSFENTITPLERAGRTFGRVQSVYNVWASTLSTPEFQTVEQDLEPALAAFRDEIVQNEKLFRRIETVYLSPDKSRLTPEQQRLVWLHYINFVRAGAKLDAAGKNRAAAINQRLAKLCTSFSQNLLADEESQVTVLKRVEDLAGLPESFRTAAAALASRLGLSNQWAIANTRSSVEPFLTYSSRRDLREQVWRKFILRGDNPGAHDNKPLINEIVRLRSERARLLNYPSYAHWRLENAMAKTPDQALALMMAIWKPALARVQEEVNDMQKIADADHQSIRIAPWDYRYYAEKVRKAKYDLDENEIKPYLQLEQLREGMFWAAGQLYGLTFKPLTHIPVYHPDVRVWEVQGRNNQHVGLWYFDPYARPGKRSGAWAGTYRNQERFEREITVQVSNNCNFMKGAPGEPVLISWDDARTLFHEFGHALHDLCSDVSYPSLSGSSVPADYVELPSQINEHWLATPELLNRFARHYQTGQSMPELLVQRIKRAYTFNQGFATTEFLASALIDMKLHLSTNHPIDPAVFESMELEKLSMPAQIVMRHRLPHFAHLFTDEGYAAGYYSYLWADTLTADAAEAFLEAGGLYDKAVAARLQTNVLSVGNTIDPAEGYRRFRGRDAGITALMRDRGFPVPAGLH